MIDFKALSEKPLVKLSVDEHYCSFTSNKMATGDTMINGSADL